MPTPKTKKINIQKISEQHLIDSKIKRRQKGVSWHRFALFVLGLAVLLGGTVIGYTFFANTPVEPTPAPQIIVPEEEEDQQETQTQTSPPPAPIKMVLISETPTGFLNVRKGAGTNFEKVGEVKPGESYELVGENEAKTWYQIKLADGTTGWVTKQYAKEKTN